MEHPSPSELIHCWNCNGTVSSLPLCHGCGKLQDLPASWSAFAVLGEPLGLAFSVESLRLKYVELSKKIHPDRFANSSPREALYASRWSRTVNQAYTQLKERSSRAEALLKCHGKHSLLKKGSVPVELAEDYFEFQDKVSDGVKDFSSFLQSLKNHRDEIEEKWATLSQLKTLTAKELESLASVLTFQRYLDSMENDIKRRTETRPEVER